MQRKREKSGIKRVSLGEMVKWKYESPIWPLILSVSRAKSFFT
jgi:hypothetical protein